MKYSDRLRKLAASTGLDAFANELVAIADEMDAEKPCAYEIPGESQGSRVLAFAPWFHKYGNELPDSSIPLFASALTPTKAQMSDERADAIMEQAQVFASAWALVGGRFDDGSMIETAENEKAELRNMLISGITAQAKEGGA